MAMFRLLAYAAVVGAISYWAYNMGGERFANRNRALEQQMTVLEDENRRLRDETDAAVAARAAAVDRASVFQRRYEQEVPQGQVHEIMGQVKQRLEEGVDPERITFVVSAVQNETRCAPEVTSRRFIVQTQVAEGANGSVSFANRAITVTGKGESAVDSSGNVAGWFDRAKPVSLNFAVPGGDSTAVKGLLPLHHAVVLGDKAHRFTVTEADARGFVMVSEQVCDYP
jgi:hypothetical protein